MLSSRSYLILGHDRPFLFYMTVYHFHDKLRTQWLYVWVNLSKNVTPWLQKLQGSFVLNFPFISIFDFKAINYCTESKNVIHIFFFFFLKIWAFLYILIQNSCTVCLRIYDTIYSVFTMIYIVYKNDHGHPNHSVGSEIGRTVMYHEEIQMYVRWRL